jgi:hypothetical protein
MDSSQLTADQLRRLVALADKARSFYAGLVRRMEARNFPPDDPLYRLAQATSQKANDLWLELHYRSCGMSAGIARANAAEQGELSRGELESDSM